MKGMITATPTVTARTADAGTRNPPFSVDFSLPWEKRHEFAELLTACQ